MATYKYKQPNGNIVEVVAKTPEDADRYLFNALEKKYGTREQAQIEFDRFANDVQGISWQLRNESKQIEAQGIKPFLGSPGASEQYFPASSAKNEGTLSSVASDIVTMPTRFAYGLGKGYEGLTQGKGLEGAKEEFKLGMAGRNPSGGMAQELAKDPAVATGVLGAGVGGVGTGILGTGVRQFLGGAIGDFAGQQLREEPANYESAAISGGLSGVTGGLIHGATAPNKVHSVARLGEAQSGSSMESLIRASTPEGREAILKAGGTEDKIAKDLIKIVTDWESYSKEWNDQIKPALDGMNDVNIAPALGKLQSRIDRLKAESKTMPDPTGATRTTIEVLEGIMSNLRMGRRGMPKTKFTANEVYKIRQATDSNLDFSNLSTGDRVGKEVNGALKEFAGDLRESLRESARASGNENYVTAMDVLAKKLDAKERLIDKIGTNKNRQLDRATSLVRGIESQARPSQGELFGDIDELFDANYAQAAKDALYARDLSAPNARTIGEISNLPVQSTGRSGLGGLMSLPFDMARSPKAFSSLYIPAAKVAERMAASDATRQGLVVGGGASSGLFGQRLGGR